ncbi:hypothetical protein GGS24DRAFT_469960 [Hypoxylon argillaceum]|nr:hypothetical protein GGS24DRAFT_469960 [Hypoxylon argillaceum]
MAALEEKPVPLPSAPIIRLAGNATLQPPLTRRGYGPGLVVIGSGDSESSYKEQQEIVDPSSTQSPRTLDPLPQKKWAEEGYAVVQLRFGNTGHGVEDWDIGTGLDKAIEALTGLETCDVKDRFGLIVYGEPSSYPPDFASQLKAAYSASERLVASISFSTAWDLTPKPSLVHVTGTPPSSPPSHDPPNPNSNANTNTNRQHHYAAAKSPTFVQPSSPDFHYASASVSHTRSLAFLKAPSALGGPCFDLEAIWDEHTAHEFATRSVAATMGTMVDAPYVNHVPVLTGGMGRDALTRFYRERFIFANPADAALELVSRTVGVDRVVDEFVFAVTHDRVVDWLLPGVPPTHKPLRIPFTSVVNIRGDRLYHEHIHWDQGTALAQAGLLPAYLPFPYALPGGRVAAPGKRLEFRVPVAGAETAAKLEDAGARPSNAMFEFAVREVDDV